MRVMIVLIAAVLGFSFSASAGAQGTGRGLDIQPGASENGMGAAGVAVPGDPSSAVWWNPAALGFTEWLSVQGTYAELVPGLADDVKYYQFAGAIPIKGFGGAGLGFTYLSYGKSEGTDASGQSTGSFTSYELSPSLSIAYRLIDELAVGLTFKYVRIKLAPDSRSGVGSTVGFDFGGLYRQPIAGMTLAFGVNVQNIGPSITFLNEDQSSPLSRNLKVGGAFTAPIPLGAGFEIGGTAALDYNQSLVTSDFETWHRGLEVYGAHEKWVRVMYRLGHYKDELGDIDDGTRGFGVRVLGLTFDMASIPQAHSSGLYSGLEDLKKYTIAINSGALASLLAAE